MERPATVQRYSTTLVVLHWLLAFLVLLSLTMGAAVLANTPNTAEKLFGLRGHMVVGVAILVLMGVRLVVRLATPVPPRATTGNAALDRIARWVHALLYLTVLLMAASGIALAVQADLGNAVFSGGELAQDFWAYPARRAHYVLSRLLMLLVALHIAGALYHRFVLRDALLSRMWFRPR